MSCHSILSERTDPTVQADDTAEPGFFADLNLDQIVAGIRAGEKDYRIDGYFHRPLTDVDSIRYRQHVFLDLERPAVRKAVDTFVEQHVTAAFVYRTKDMRADEHDLNHYYRARFFLTAAERYCEAVMTLHAGLRDSDLRSKGMRGLLDHLTRYLASDHFTTLHSDAAGVHQSLDAVRYSIAINGDRIAVGPFDEEADYGEQVAATFARFRSTPSGGSEPRGHSWETYASTGVLDLVAQVYPEVFADLDRFCTQHLEYLDDTIGAFDREVQFYLGYLDYLAPLRAAGLPFSYPSMSMFRKDELALDTFDLALATSLLKAQREVVYNDIALDGSERILVISGPNNGGKTTLARAFGQLHHLARLGCAVPGHDVRLLLCDQIFVHFERAEDAGALVGKLQEELDRLRADFDQATARSVFVLNEMFSSTTAQDALFLSRRILQRVMDLDTVCVCVTFLDELANWTEQTVSMVSTVSADDPSCRTYRVVRRAADGRAYARAIADKYGLGYNQLVEEIGR